MVTTVWQCYKVSTSAWIDVSSLSRVQTIKIKKKMNICWLHRIQKEKPETNSNRNDNSQISFYTNSYFSLLTLFFSPSVLSPPPHYTPHLDSQRTHTCSPCPPVSAMFPFVWIFSLVTQFLQQQMSNMWRRLVDNNVADQNQHGTKWHQHQLGAHLKPAQVKSIFGKHCNNIELMAQSLLKDTPH